MLVTRMLRDSRIAAREAAAMPFPNEETTPPLTKTYLAIYPTRGEIGKFTGFSNLHKPTGFRPSCRRDARHEYSRAWPKESPAGAAERGEPGRCARQVRRRSPSCASPGQLRRAPRRSG